MHPLRYIDLSYVVVGADDLSSPAPRGSPPLPMSQFKTEHEGLTLWYMFNPGDLRRRFKFNEAEYKAFTQDMAQGAEQVARAYLREVSRDTSTYQVRPKERANLGLCWGTFNWEAPQVLSGFEIRDDKARLLLPSPALSVDLFWEVLGKRTTGEFRRSFYQWVRVAVLSLQAANADLDPFLDELGGLKPFRVAVQQAWSLIGDVVKVRSGIAAEAEGTAPSGARMWIKRHGDTGSVVAPRYLVGGPSMPERLVEDWAVDMLAWQVFRNQLVARIDEADAEADAKAARAGASDLDIDLPDLPALPDVLDPSGRPRAKLTEVVDLAPVRKFRVKQEIVAKGFSADSGDVIDLPPGSDDAPGKLFRGRKGGVFQTPSTVPRSLVLDLVRQGKLVEY